MKIQVFIFNYNHFEDAMELFETFEELDYDTYLLNCKSPSDPEFKETDRIKKYENIYYSGQWNEMIWLSSCDVVLIINSDVKIPKPRLLMKRLENFYTSYGKKAGIYAPNYEWTPWTYNPSLLPSLELGLKEVPTTDSTIWAVTHEIAKKVDFIDTKINLFGWGIEIVAAYFCKLEGKYVVRDYALKCYHPRNTGYSRYEADIQWREWIAKKGFGKGFWEYYNTRDLYEFGWDGDYQPSIEFKLL